MSLIRGKHARLTLRAKFKSPYVIEICVMDHDTQEEWILFWNFVSGEVTELGEAEVNEPDGSVQNEEVAEEDTEDDE